MFQFIQKDTQSSGNKKQADSNSKNNVDIASMMEGQTCAINRNAAPAQRMVEEEDPKQAKVAQGQEELIQSKLIQIVPNKGKLMQSAMIQRAGAEDGELIQGKLAAMDKSVNVIENGNGAMMKKADVDVAASGGGNVYPNGMTITEAVDHARYGEGDDVFMPLSAVDLSKVKVSDFKGVTLNVNLGGKYKTNWNDHIVHGTITLELVNHNIVQISGKTDFNFEVGAKNGHPWVGQGHQFWRNVATLGLEWYVNNGHVFGYKPYNINYTGTATISY